MLKAVGDMWRLDGTKVTPTNCVIKRNGELVMGAGVALQAKQKYPSLPLLAGQILPSRELFPLYIRTYDLILFPTKKHYNDNSDMKFIERGLKTLKDMPTDYNLSKVILPALGCGYGGLKLEDVEPLLHKYLDDRFTLVVKE